MRALLGIAAATIAVLAIPAGPAAAEDSERAFARVPLTSAHSGFGHDFRHDRRRHRGRDTVLVYDRDYQGDTAWKSDSFNDWWHDRRDRSYPAWVQRNERCDRQWWSGTTLRC